MDDSIGLPMVHGFLMVELGSFCKHYTSNTAESYVNGYDENNGYGKEL